MGVATGAAHGQGAAWQTVQLNYGIRLDVPCGWTTNRPEVAERFCASERVADATALVADEGGEVISFAGPSPDSNEVSLHILIMPTRVSQASLASMSDAAIRAAEANEFKPEVEAMARRNQLRIMAWNGTVRRMIGGRYGLVTSYRYRYPNGREVLKQTYSIYLGSRSINVHAYRRIGADPRVAAALDHMIESLVVSVDAL